MKKRNSIVAALLVLLLCVTLLPAQAGAVCAEHDLYQLEGSYKLPTCTASGSYTLLCRNCDYVETFWIDATGHSFEVSHIDPATCTTNGTRYKECINCHEVWTETILSEGHSWGEWHYRRRPTCVSPGARSRKCSACNGVQTETVAATGQHRYGSWMVISVATCTESGKRVRRCGDCNYVQMETLQATGQHKFGQWVEATPATCSEEGIRVRECDCGYTEREAIPMTEHTWDEGTVVAQPSTASEGIMLYVCTGCEMQRTRSIPKLTSGGKTETPPQPSSQATEPDVPESSTKPQQESGKTTDVPTSSSESATASTAASDTPSEKPVEPPVESTPKENPPKQGVAAAENGGFPVWAVALIVFGTAGILAAVIVAIVLLSKKRSRNQSPKA